MPGIGHNGGPPLDEGEQPEDRSEFEALMGMSVEDVLREGQKALFADLVGLVRSGKASHQEKAILRNILRDNGLTLGIPPEGSSNNEAPEEQAPLPVFEEPEWDAR